MTILPREAPHDLVMMVTMQVMPIKMIKIHPVVVHLILAMAMIVMIHANIIMFKEMRMILRRT